MKEQSESFFATYSSKVNKCSKCKSKFDCCQCKQQGSGGYTCRRKEKLNSRIGLLFEINGPFTK
jgi:hypothetical protein